MTDEYRRGLSEAEVLIGLLDPSLQAKIPENFKNMIKTNKMQGYNPTVDPNKPLNKQFSKDAYSILAVIHYNYFCKTQEEKDRFLGLFKNNSGGQV